MKSSSRNTPAGSSSPRFECSTRSGISTKLTGTDTRFEVGRDGAGGLCENAIVRIRRRIEKTFDDTSRHIDLWIKFAQFEQFPHDLAAGGLREDFEACLADLRSEQAHPDLRNLRAVRPQV